MYIYIAYKYKHIYLIGKYIYIYVYRAYIYIHISICKYVCIAVLAPFFRRPQELGIFDGHELTLVPKVSKGVGSPRSPGAEGMAVEMHERLGVYGFDSDNFQ